MALRNMRSFNPMTGRRTGAYSRISNAADREEYLAHLRKLKRKYHERKAKETEGEDRKFHEHMAKSLLGEASTVNRITGEKRKVDDVQTNSPATFNWSPPKNFGGIPKGDSYDDHHGRPGTIDRFIDYVTAAETGEGPFGSAVRDLRQTRQTRRSSLGEPSSPDSPPKIPIEPRRSDKYSADQKAKARQNLLKLGTVYKPAKDEYDKDLAARKRAVQKYTGTSPEEKRAQERARREAVKDKAKTQIRKFASNPNIGYHQFLTRGLDPNFKTKFR